MLESVTVIMIVFWLLGMGTGYTMNGFVHVFLVIAVVSVLVRVIQEEKYLIKRATFCRGVGQYVQFLVLSTEITPFLASSALITLCS
ncbi:MAG: lmo0937 family membrane protein [Xanthomonadaceae bacterium]|nr:lmo0937 family membrane protein [Xanthomonadaceae bacterium]